MKKEYIKPNNKVHVLLPIHMVAETTPVDNGGIKDPEEELVGARDNNSVSGGSSNIWDNQW